MKLRTLLERLSYGPLSNLNFGNKATGMIRDEHVPKFVTYVNQGLVRLHTRFVLVEKDLLIAQVAHITEYRLTRENSEFGSRGRPSKYPFIKDLPCEPFDGDVIRLLAVFDRYGERPLNDGQKPRPVFTPKPIVLQVPDPKEGEPLSVSYQANHKPLCLRRDEAHGGVGAVLDQWIEIPVVLEEALESYVAAKAHSHMQTDASKAMAVELMTAVEGLCREVEATDLVSQTQSGSHDKFAEKGFA